VWASGVRAPAGYEVMRGSCFHTLDAIATSSVAAANHRPSVRNHSWEPSRRRLRRLESRLGRAMGQGGVGVAPRAVWRVVAPGGYVLVFSQGEFTEVVRRRISFDGIRWQALVWIHGDFSSNTYNQDFLAATTHEDITVFYRSEGIKRLPLFQARQRQIGTHLDYPKAPQPRASMKPVGLLEELIRRYSRKGDSILDCCMGTGICGVAALASGRKFLGVEARQDTFGKAARWLESSCPMCIIDGE